MPKSKNIDYDALFIEYNRLPLGGVVAIDYKTDTIAPVKRVFKRHGLIEKQDFTARASAGTCYVRRLSEATIH